MINLDFLAIFITFSILFVLNYNGNYDSIFLEFSEAENSILDEKDIFDQSQNNCANNNVNYKNSYNSLLKQFKTCQIHLSDALEEISSLQEKITIQNLQVQNFSQNENLKIESAVNKVKIIYELKLKDLENQNNTIRGQKETVQHNRELNNQIQLFEEQNKELVNKNNQLTQQMREQNLISKNQNFEVQTMEKQISQIKEQAQFHISLMQSKVSQVNQSFIDQQQQLYQLKSDNQRLNEQQETNTQCTTQQIKKYENTIHCLQQEVYSLNKQLVNYQQVDENTDIRDQVKNLKEIVLSIKQHSQLKQQQLKQDIKKLQTQMQDKILAQTILQEKYDNLKKLNVQLAKQSTEKIAENNRITSKLKSMTKSDDIKGQISRAILENTRLENQLKEMKELISNNVIKQQYIDDTEKKENLIFEQLNQQNAEQFLVQDIVLNKENQLPIIIQKQDNLSQEQKVNINTDNLSIKNGQPVTMIIPAILHQQQQEIQQIYPEPFNYSVESEISQYKQIQLKSVSNFSSMEEINLGDINIQLDIPKKPETQHRYLPGIKQINSSSSNTTQGLNLEYKLPANSNACSDADLLNYQVQITEFANLK
eukprot:EST43899.1 Hypothetical protein SS50377_16199 [Spironucleus salmonicida]